MSPISQVRLGRLYTRATLSEQWDMKRYERFVAGGLLGRQLPALEFAEPVREDTEGSGWGYRKPLSPAPFAWDDLAFGVDRIFDRRRGVVT